MNLIRLIAIAVIFWLLYRLILTLLSKGRRPTVHPSAPREGEAVVRCEQCGVHIPQSQALKKDGKYYCCEEHRSAADNWKRGE